MKVTVSEESRLVDTNVYIIDISFKERFASRDSISFWSFHLANLMYVFMNHMKLCYDGIVIYIQYGSYYRLDL